MESKQLTGRGAGEVSGDCRAGVHCIQNTSEGLSGSPGVASGASDNLQENTITSVKETERHRMRGKVSGCGCCRITPKEEDGGGSG